MRHLILAMTLTTFGAGCASYTQIQMKLVEQARKGVASAATFEQDRAALAAQVYQLRRQRLDEAFDADVRANESIDAEWVIDHRRAYAAALEAYAKAEAGSAAAQATARQTLSDTEVALQKLLWLQSIQLKWMSLEQEITR
jgi:hypothetical protein